jgi:hypothetical protein
MERLFGGKTPFQTCLVAAICSLDCFEIPNLLRHPVVPVGQWVAPVVLNRGRRAASGNCVRFALMERLIGGNTLCPMPLVAAQHWLGQPVLPISAAHKSGRALASGPGRHFWVPSTGWHGVKITYARMLRLTRAVAAIGAVVAAVLVAAAIRAAFAATFVAAAAGRRGRRGRGEREHAGAQGKRSGQGEQRFGKHDETHFLVDGGTSGERAWRTT